jgi:hypothetical protein
MAEVVWGDGSETYRKIFPLQETHEFQHQSFVWELEAKSWKWARLAVWDIAGNGAFVNPTQNRDREGAALKGRLQ